MLVKPEHQDHVHWQGLVQRATTSRKHHLKLHRQKNYGMLPLAFADRGYIQYGLGVNLYNLRLLDTEIRFSLAKDEEQAQMDTKVGSTTNVDASKRKSPKPLSRL
jgi:hypothetical protein